MDMNSFSVPINGRYDTRERFSEEAVRFIKGTISSRTAIPSSDFGSELSGEWQSISPTNSPIKKFEGEIRFNHVLDQRLGYEWVGDIQVVSTGEGDEAPCERFSGQIQLVVFE